MMITLHYRRIIRCRYLFLDQYRYPRLIITDNIYLYLRNKKQKNINQNGFPQFKFCDWLFK